MKTHISSKWLTYGSLCILFPSLTLGEVEVTTAEETETEITEVEDPLNPGGDNEEETDVEIIDEGDITVVDDPEDSDEIEIEDPFLPGGGDGGDDAEESEATEITVLEAQWTGTNGEFDVPGNWSNGEVPTANTNVTFGQDGLDSAFWTGATPREVRNINSSRAGGFFLGGANTSIATQRIHVELGDLHIFSNIIHEAAHVYRVNQSSTLFLHGGITSPHPVLKFGEGELALRSDINTMVGVHEGTISIRNHEFTGTSFNISGNNDEPSILRIENKGVIKPSGINVLMVSQPGRTSILEIAGDDEPGTIREASITASGEGTNILRFNHLNPEYFFTETGSGQSTPVPIDPGSILNVAAVRGSTTLLANYDLNGTHSIGAEGVLRFGNGTQAGSLNGPIQNNGILVFDRSNSMTFNHPITGNGEVRYTGGGVYSLSGGFSNTYRESTTVDGARLRVSDDALLGHEETEVRLQDGGTLQNLSTDVSLNPSREVILANGEGRLRAGFESELEVRGLISGPGDLRVVNDSGTVLLGQRIHEFDGQLIIGGDGANGGFANAINANVVLGRNLTLPPNTTVAFDAGEDKNGILDMAGYMQSIAALENVSGHAHIINNGESSTSLTLTGPEDTEFDGNIGTGILLRQRSGGTLALRSTEPGAYENTFQVDHGSLVLDGTKFSNNASARNFRTNVGISETADVLLTNGAHLRSNLGQIGVASGSTGTVVAEGSDTRWELEGDLSIGTANSAGRLVVRDGAEVTTQGKVDLRGSVLLQDGGALRGLSSGFLNTIQSNPGPDGIRNRIVIGGEDAPAPPGFISAPSLEISSGSQLDLIFNHDSESYDFGLEIEGTSGGNIEILQQAGRTRIFETIVANHVEVSGGTLFLTTGLSSRVDVKSGARLSSGSTGGIDQLVQIRGGGVISPGDPIGGLIASVIEFEPGAIVEWNIQDPNGNPGIGWSQLLGATLDAVPAAPGDSPIVIRLNTMYAAGAPGAMSGFDPNQSYQWRIARYFTRIDPAFVANVELDATNFVGAAGVFSLNLVPASGSGGNDELFVVYTPSAATFADWATSNGLTGEDALPAATPAGDGVPNLLKYAWRIGAMDAFPTGIKTSTTWTPFSFVVDGAEGLSEVTEDGVESIVIPFNKYPAISVVLPAGIQANGPRFTDRDLIFIVEASTDLTDWSDEGVELALIEEMPDFVNAIFASRNAPMSQTEKLFFRVRVELVSSMVSVTGGQLPGISDLGALDVATFEIGKYEVTWVCMT